jgi:hypothetical protein
VICCLIAAVLVGGSTRFRRSVPVLHDTGMLLLGAGLGGLLVEGLAAFCTDLHWLHQGRHPAGVVALVGSWAVVSVAGLCLGERSLEQRTAALVMMAACGGALLTEILDLHVLRLYVAPSVPATVLLHSPSIALGIAAAGLMMLGRGPRRVVGHPGSQSPRRQSTIAEAPARRHTLS